MRGFLYVRSYGLSIFWGLRAGRSHSTAAFTSSACCLAYAEHDVGVATRSGLTVVEFDGVTGLMLAVPAVKLLPTLSGLQGDTIYVVGLRGPAPNRSPRSA